MFYFIFVIVLLILFFVSRKDKRAADKYLLSALLMFMLDIVTLIFYVSKDVYYYNVLNHYFMFPEEVWNVLMYSDISRNALIWMMNLCSLLFIYFCVYFAFTFMSDRHLQRNKKLRIGLIIWLAVQFVIYNPNLYQIVYTAVCGNLLDASQIVNIVYVTEILTRTVNLLILGSTMVIILIANSRVNQSNFFSGYALGESICFICVVVAYGVIFWFAPSLLIRVSKLAGYITYIQVPLTQGNMLIYQFFPYYLTVAGIAILFFILRYIKLQQQFDNNELEIKRQIDAAVVTSRAFCHFMKNELLSIQSEIELFEVGEENREAKEQIVKECEFLYARLDDLHHNTKLSELTLKQTDIREMMDQILAHMTIQLQKCRVITDYKQVVSYVMIDRSSFEQAIHNIISNAVDAMCGGQQEDHILSIRIETIDNWVQLSISDNGCGISEEDLSNIFSPFVSSQPIKKHWGIGLTLTYKIIEAHGGKIEVNSIEKKGTIFKILLPSMIAFDYD